jgi:CBF1 interacting corepressor
MSTHKFLNLKGWHPSNKANQKKIWIAEQKTKNSVTRNEEAAREVEKETELLKMKRIAASRGDKNAQREADQAQMNFMYAPPPGYQKDQDRTEAEDEAVKDFQRKLRKRDSNFSATAVQPALEKQVGRKVSEGLTLDEQVERFPMLKDAPVEGNYTDNVKVNFKPLGVEIRNIRCLRCGEWGHQSGDRECRLRDFNPHDAARQRMEDPMTYMANMNAGDKQTLILRKAAMPSEMQHRVGASMAANQQMLVAEPGDYGYPMPDDDEAEEAFLAKLSYKDKKLLLRKLKQQEGGEDDDVDGGGGDFKKSKKSKKKKDKKKKHKKKKSGKKRKRDANDSDGSASSDDSDDVDDRTEKAKIRAAEEMIRQAEATMKAGEKRVGSIVSSSYLPTSNRAQGTQGAHQDSVAAAPTADGHLGLLTTLKYQTAAVLDRSKKSGRSGASAPLTSRGGGGGGQFNQS